MDQIVANKQIKKIAETDVLVEKVVLPIDEEKYLEELNKRRITSKTKNVTESVIADMVGTFGTK